MSNDTTYTALDCYDRNDWSEISALIITCAEYNGLYDEDDSFELWTDCGSNLLICRSHPYILDLYLNGTCVCSLVEWGGVQLDVHEPSLRAVVLDILKCEVLQ